MVRDKAGLRWTRADEWMLRFYATGVRVLFRLMPEILRVHPRARDAYKRARGKLPPDAPLVDAPPIFGPPKHHRGLPQHHQPAPHHASLPVVLAPQAISGALLITAAVCRVIALAPVSC